MATFTTPGIYIQEVTGPGVIAGVGTSTAAFIGPATAGPLLDPRRVSSFDEYLALFGTLPDGTIAPYITVPRTFYLTHAVRGFFENGGAGVCAPRRDREAGRLGRQEPGRHARGGVRRPGGRRRHRRQWAHGCHLGFQSHRRRAELATATAKVATIDGTKTRVTVDDVSPFRVGDTITVNQAATAVLAGVDTGSKVLTLQAPLAGLNNGDTATLAHVAPSAATVRLSNPADAQNLFPGSIVLMKGKASVECRRAGLRAVQAVNRSSGVVTLALRRPHEDFPPRRDGHGVDLAGVYPVGHTVRGFDDQLPQPVTQPGPPRLRLPRGQLGPPDRPPAPGAAGRRHVPRRPGRGGGERDSDGDRRRRAPANSLPDDYQAGLDRLKDVQDVNIVCIPDAASHSSSLDIQQRLIGHCVDPAVLDRVAVLDAVPRALPRGRGASRSSGRTSSRPRGTRRFITRG